MNRTDRLMGFITHLQSKKYRTAEQMAAHFGISVRTVFRDLKAMQEIGVPIGFEPGQGYFIAGGYFLPPVSLTAEEANALALTEPLVLRFADKETATHVGTALAKIKMVLGKSRGENLEQIQSKTAHYIPEIYEHLLPDNNYLPIIQQAISNNTMLRLEYANAQGESTLREVEPIGLTFYSLNWHLIAWCHLRGEYRDFRTSRMRSVQSTIMPFRKKDHLPLHEYLQTIDLKSGQEYL